MMPDNSRIYVPMTPAVCNIDREKRIAYGFLFVYMHVVLFLHLWCYGAKVPREYHSM